MLRAAIVTRQSLICEWQRTTTAAAAAAKAQQECCPLALRLRIDRCPIQCVPEPLRAFKKRTKFCKTAIDTGEATPTRPVPTSGIERYGDHQNGQIHFSFLPIVVVVVVVVGANEMTFARMDEELARSPSSGR